ncbi:MAG: hypothetical protein COB15_16755 [Flavobacteriales bacterium]|nr:MAG: hypothetical protein COB15_16755 [Flavobacteriales bacterium]
MKLKNTITSAAFLLLGLGGLHAQESINGSGGEATGTGGTASYSVGQIVYTTATGTNGSVAQGVQQPFEIYAVGVSEIKMDISLSIYPNPTTNYLTLKTDDNANLSYQLIDLQGKVIENKKVTTITSTIKMDALPKAIYFLNVTRSNQIVKTFKVIKQ